MMSSEASRFSQAAQTSMNLDAAANEGAPPVAESELSTKTPFRDADWQLVPASPGAYVIWDLNEVVYVGMAGRNGNGGLRNRLRDHASGQIVNMFAQYLFLARVQFLEDERIRHPRAAKEACRRYIFQRCAFQYCVTDSAAAARLLESRSRRTLRPSLNPSE